MRPEDEYRLRAQSNQRMYASSDATRDTAERKHPGCLSLWLWANLILTPVAIVLLLPYAERLSRAVSPFSVLLMFGSLALTGVMAFYILRWKRWAVQLFVVLLAFNFVLDILFNKVDIRTIGSAVVGAAMIWFFIRPNWDSYE